MKYWWAVVLSFSWFSTMREVGATAPPMAPFKASAHRGSVAGESSRRLMDSCSTAESSCDVSEPGNSSSSSNWGITEKVSWCDKLTFTSSCLILTLSKWLYF